MPRPFEIGQMRWKVTLVREQLVPDPINSGTVETFIDQREVWADIQPVASAQTINGEQIEFSKITHKIIIRNQGTYLNEYEYAIRERFEPDGSKITEKFRLWRMLEVAGRQRFIDIEAELVSSK